jgi:endoglucanase
MRGGPLALAGGVAAALVAVAALAAGVVAGRSGHREGSATPPPPAGAASTAVADFLATYVEPDGRVVRRDQGGDTVSEGQAYALMLAAATGDGTSFDLVWDWTRTNLQRPDGLFAWRWQDGRVADDNPATDADIDIAGALATAADRLDRPELRDEARRVAAAVLDHETAQVADRLVFVAGPWASPDRVVNPSYLAGCGAADLADVSGDRRWSKAAGDTRALVRSLARDGLPPDWATVDHDGAAQPVAGPDDLQGPGRYGLDAARIPARLAACPAGRPIAADLWNRIRHLDDDGAATAYTLDGRRAAAGQHPVGLVGAAAAAQAAGDETAAARLFAEAAALERQSPTYYGAAWLALGEVLLGLHGGGGASGGESAGAVVVPAAWAAPAQPEPTTTSPPATPAQETTVPPTTAPPTTTPPTTAPSTTGTTAAGSASTTAPATGGAGRPPATTTPGSGTTTQGGSGAGPGSSTPGSSTPGSTGSRPDGSGAGGSGTGDLSSSGEPGGQVATGSQGAHVPGEPARRRTGAITLTGLAAIVALGAALGLRERAHLLRVARRPVGVGDRQ